MRKTMLVLLAIMPLISCNKGENPPHAKEGSSDSNSNKQLSLTTQAHERRVARMILVPATQQQNKEILTEIHEELSSDNITDTRKIDLERMKSNMKMLTYSSSEDDKFHRIEVEPKLIEKQFFKLEIKWASDHRVFEAASLSVRTVKRLKSFCTSAISGRSRWNFVGVFELDESSYFRFQFPKNQKDDFVDGIRLTISESPQLDDESTEQIIDSTTCDTSILSLEGQSWSTHTDSKAYGGSLLLNHTIDSGAYLTPFLENPGYYEILFKEIDPSLKAKFQIIVNSQNGDHIIDLGKSTVKNGWHHLGAFEFIEGFGSSISFIPTPGSVLAIDAVKFRYKGETQEHTDDAIGIWTTDLKSTNLIGDWIEVGEGKDGYIMNTAGNGSETPKIEITPKVAGSYEIRLKWPEDLANLPPEKISLTVDTPKSPQVIHNIELSPDHAETWYSLGDTVLRYSTKIIISRIPMPDSGTRFPIRIRGLQLKEN